MMCKLYELIEEYENFFPEIDVHNFCATYTVVNEIKGIFSHF